MSSWETDIVANIADVRVSNVDKKSHIRETPVRLCNYMDVYSHDYIRLETDFMEATATTAEIERFRVARGDVLLTKDSETPDDIGIPAAVVDDIAELVCGYHLALLRPRADRVDSIYLAKQLASTKVARRFARLASGSTRYGLSNGAISGTPVPLPPLPVQRRIAEILSTVDEAIESTEKLIAKHQQIKAGLMHDLFTRGLTPDGLLRPPHTQAPDLYKDSPLGPIPKDWEVVPTSEKLSVIDPQPDHRTPPAVSEGYAYVGTGDITPTGEIDFQRARKVSVGAFEKQLRSFSIHPCAFIFGKIGTLGQPTRIPHERFFAISANVVLLTSPSSSDSDYGYWHFHSALTAKQVADATNTTSQPALGIERIREFLLAWPSANDERRAVSERLESISAVLAKETLMRRKLRQLKRGLMHDLLTGKVEVPIPDDSEESA